MDGTVGSRIVKLERTLALRRARGVALRVLEGVAWLTSEGAAGDIFLRAGETHVIGSDGLTLIEALGTAACVVEVREARPRRAPALRFADHPTGSQAVFR